MSVNRYDPTTGSLTNIASGQRTWVGTQAAYKAAKQAGTLPNNAIIAITDDEQDHNHYSTEEVETGMYWIDGKPIYRKVVDCGAGPAAGVTKTINHNIANIERFTHLEMMGDNNSNYWVIPWFDSNRKWYWYANRTIISITSGTGSDATLYNHLAILEYTKTTD